MYKSIYECFKPWRDKGMIYFYSDPHFGDEEMQYLRNNYIGDEEQVKSINKSIGKNDTLFILGDIGDESYIQDIRGRKILVMGNHDKGVSIYKNLFDEIFEGPLFLSSKILLSHEPINLPFAFNIHGHDHSNQFNGFLSNHLNVCAEQIGYKPIPLSWILNSGLLNQVNDIHRMTINKVKNKI